MALRQRARCRDPVTGLVHWLWRINNETLCGHSRGELSGSPWRIVHGVALVTCVECTVMHLGTLNV